MPPKTAATKAMASAPATIAEMVPAPNAPRPWLSEEPVVMGEVSSPGRGGHGIVGCTPASTAGGGSTIAGGSYTKGLPVGGG